MQGKNEHRERIFNEAVRFSSKSFMNKIFYLQQCGIDVWLENKAVAQQLTKKPAQKIKQEQQILQHRIEQQTTWEVLQKKVNSCTACSLHQTRTHVVFGVGNYQADLMFIGEAPGAQEDAKGEPFVGRAGQLLTEMLKAIDLQREQVFIANILKCRPPNNRDPNPLEVATCTPFLDQQIKLIQPKLIVALGRIAAQYLLKTQLSLTRLRGIEHTYGPLNTPLIVTFHPAYLLRSPSEKRKAYEDLLRIKSKIIKI